MAMAKRKKKNPRDDALGEYDRLGEEIEAARAELHKEGDELEDPAERHWPAPQNLIQVL